MRSDWEEWVEIMLARLKLLICDVTTINIWESGPFLRHRQENKGRNQFWQYIAHLRAFDRLVYQRKLARGAHKILGKQRGGLTQHTHTAGHLFIWNPYNIASTVSDFSLLIPNLFRWSFEFIDDVVVLCTLLLCTRSGGALTSARLREWR